MSGKKQSFCIEWEQYVSYKSLDKVSKELYLRARDISRKAYAPYSGFQVGAAILLKNGQIVLGTNQENAAYPDGLCAERVAVFSASTQFPDEEMDRIAIAAYNEKKHQFVGVAPCGSCRQALLEYEFKQGTPIKVIIAGETGSIIIFNKVEDLLPVAFSKKEME